MQRERSVGLRGFGGSIWIRGRLGHVDQSWGCHFDSCEGLKSESATLTYLTVVVCCCTVLRSAESRAEVTTVHASGLCIRGDSERCWFGCYEAVDEDGYCRERRNFRSDGGCLMDADSLLAAKRDDVHEDIDPLFAHPAPESSRELRLQYSTYSTYRTVQ